MGVSKEIKGNSDKTVPDCLHVCRVFWCNPFFSPVQLDKNSWLQHKRRQNSDQTSVQPLYTGFCIFSNIYPFIHPPGPLHCHSFAVSSRHEHVTVRMNRMTHTHKIKRPTTMLTSHPLHFSFFVFQVCPLVSVIIVLCASCSSSCLKMKMKWTWRWAFFG